MDEYNVLPTYPDEGLVEGRVLRRAIAQSRGGMLTGNVQAGQGTTLPQTIAGYRQREAELYKQGSDLYNAEPDMSQLQAYARSRGQEGEGAMLNALAAQFAGESFQPVQAQYLKRAAAAQDPMKVGGGMLTPDGQFIKDPFASQDKKAEFLLRQAQAYGQMATSAETRAEQQAYRAQQDRFMNELRAYMAQTGRMQAETARTRADATTGGGQLGAGTANQIGSGPNREPVFRDNAGRLFTYDAQGNPVRYMGDVLPKAGNAEPTEDERKAAGWFAQADNARRNMAAIVQRNPQAAYPTVTERGVSMIPGVGSDVAYAMSPADRQMFIQASESMAEALLRAATGAGVNRDEQAQKVRELVPRVGESPESVKQKMAAYDMYMGALRTRANRALPGGAGGAAAPGVNPQDPLGMR
jgi:hypothetical protein